MIDDVLIVDDDETLRSVLSRSFQRRGTTVYSAANHQQALTLTAQYQPQKAVVDLKLDQESGLQLLPALLQLNPTMQIVMLTGYSSITTAVEAIKLGAVNYLCKPADVDDILQSFEQHQGNPEVELANDPLSVNRLEWEHIQKVLAEYEGNVSATARALGMHRRTLQRKLQKRPVKH